MKKIKFEILIISLIFISNISIGILHFFNLVSITLITLNILFVGLITLFFSIKDIKINRKYFYFLISFFIIFIWIFYKLNLILNNRIFDLTFQNMIFPKFNGIPILIGFVFLTGNLLTISFTYTIGFVKGDLVKSTFISALFATLYIFLMEPAAQKLGFWSWNTTTTGVEYYIIWFLINSLISFAGYKFELFYQIKSKYLNYILIAQIIGFSLSQISFKF